MRCPAGAQALEFAQPFELHRLGEVREDRNAHDQIEPRSLQRRGRVKRQIYKRCRREVRPRFAGCEPLERPAIQARLDVAAVLGEPDDPSRDRELVAAYRRTIGDPQRATQRLAADTIRPDYQLPTTNYQLILVPRVGIEPTCLFRNPGFRTTLPSPH